MVSRLGYQCAYCGLRVRLEGDPRHPGHGVVEELTKSGEPMTLPGLEVLHRFCASALRAGSGGDTMLRRAWLGWVTDRFEASRPRRHFGIRHYSRLGLHPARMRAPRLFRKHWQVRKMRCAALASHYYANAR